MEAVLTRVCSKCKIPKPLELFGKHKGQPLGRRYACRLCENATAKIWRETNPEKTKVATQKYYLANTEKIRQIKRDSRLKRLDYYKKYQQIYRQQKPELHASDEQRRRARKRNNGTFLILEKDLKKLYRSNCFYCGANAKITADHVVPISRGGIHGIGNLVPACQTCNSQKQNKLITEWRNRQDKE